MFGTGLDYGVAVEPKWGGGVRKKKEKWWKFGPSSWGATSKGRHRNGQPVRHEEKSNE